jgi:hypothetical protein
MRALLRFLSEAEGGRSAPPQSGYHPQVKVGSFQTSCRIESVSPPDVVFAFGIVYEVELRLMFESEVEILTGNRMAELFPVGTKLEFFEGSRKVAEGQVTVPPRPDVP